MPKKIIGFAELHSSQQDMLATGWGYCLMEDGSLSGVRFDVPQAPDILANKIAGMVLVGGYGSPDVIPNGIAKDISGSRPLSQKEFILAMTDGTFWDLLPERYMPLGLDWLASYKK